MGTPVSDMVIMLYILFYTYFGREAYPRPRAWPRAWLGLSLQRQKGEILNRNSPFFVGAKINLAEI